MSILISVQNLEKTFGAQTLFRNLSFGVETGDRIGLIGPNGAGKSTLLRILAGRSTADDGDIARSRGLKLAFLEQSPEFDPEKSVYETLADDVDDSHLGSVFEWIARLGLERGNIAPETPMGHLSGGWRKRVALARELLREPDLLLLDEPTNHLDLESILWLEDLLREARFATLTVTHDRLFLERVANRIFELDRRNPDGLLVIQGTYTDYRDAKEQLLHAQARRQEVVANTLRRETEWLRRGAKARQTKQKARIERAGQLKDESEDLFYRTMDRKAKIDFQTADRNPQKLIEAKGVSKAYGERKLFGPLDLLITPKTRLGLLGPNGAGKSTLIRVLLGEETPDSGQVTRADRLQVAYFAQHIEEFDPKKTVLRTICPEGDYVDFRGQFIVARSYLDRFLFRREQVDMPVEKLSGGEKSRLRIAQLMLQKANVLVLDEPTNDLDLDTLNVLEGNLQDFDGAVVLVTHDRFFLDQVADQILAFARDEDGQGTLEWFAGYAQWEKWIDTNKGISPRAKHVEPAPVAKAATKRRLSFKEKHELETIEPTILEAETRLKTLQSETQKPEIISNAAKLTELSTEMASLEQKIEKLYARWAELEKSE